MTDAISTYGRLPQPASTSRSVVDKADKKAASQASTGSVMDMAAAMVPVSAPPVVRDDVLSLSNVTQRVKDEPDFDRAKVESIKQAIQQGQYPLNPRRIAESFIAIEQMIRD